MVTPSATENGFSRHYVNFGKSSGNAPCCSHARAGKLKIIGINESNQCQYRSISDVDK